MEGSHISPDLVSALQGSCLPLGPFPWAKRVWATPSFQQLNCSQTPPQVLSDLDLQNDLLMKAVVSCWYAKPSSLILTSSRTLTNVRLYCCDWQPIWTKAQSTRLDTCETFLIENCTCKSKLSKIVRTSVVQRACFCIGYAWQSSVFMMQFGAFNSVLITIKTKW